MIRATKTQSGSVQKKEASYSVPAVEAMLEIVEYLSIHPEGCGVSELSRRLNLSTNLIFRIMKCLLERGYVQANENMAYSLSARWLSLGALLANNFDLNRLARRYLQEMCNELEFSCLLQTLEGNHMLVQDAVAPNKAFYLQVTSGVQLSLNGNAFAKAILAWLPEEKHPFSQEELQKIRQEGIAYDWEEYTKGIFCIAGPVFTAERRIAGAIGVTGLISHLSEDKKSSVIQSVRTQAANLSRAIGGDPDFYSTEKSIA